MGRAGGTVDGGVAEAREHVFERIFAGVADVELEGGGVGSHFKVADIDHGGIDGDFGGVGGNTLNHEAVL